MVVRLRGHHLLCVLTFVGRGYSPSFISNMSMIVERIKSGEEINIISSPDDICEGFLQHDDCHCHDASVKRRDELALQDLQLKIGDSFIYTAQEISEKRRAFLSGAIRSACVGCEWYGTCTTIAANQFAEAKL